MRAWGPPSPPLPHPITLHLGTCHTELGRVVGEEGEMHTSTQHTQAQHTYIFPLNLAAVFSQSFFH